MRFRNEIIIIWSKRKGREVRKRKKIEKRKKKKGKKKKKMRDKGKNKPEEFYVPTLCETTIIFPQNGGNFFDFSLD